MNNSDKLLNILSIVLDVTASCETSSQNTESWDSLRHLNLILVLEEEFSVSLKEEEVVKIMSYADIVEVLSKYGVEFS